MTKQVSKPGRSDALPCQPLASALALHLDGGSGHLAGPWALGWDHEGLKAGGQSPASPPASA